MATTQSNETFDAIHQFHERFGGALRRQAEQIEKLGQDLKYLQNEQQQLEEIAARLIEPLKQNAAGSEKARVLSPSGILCSVRKLSVATYADQVLTLLAEEAAPMGIRAAVFDVRGRAAWGCSAGGFEPAFSGEALRTLVVPLNHDGPFREVFETGEAVETSTEDLAANRVLRAKLGPAANARVLLIPVRSAGSVAAILYAEIGERRDPILSDVLKVLAEFAGAQIDRLMAVNGGYIATDPAQKPEQQQAAQTGAAGMLEPRPESSMAEDAIRSSAREVAPQEEAKAAQAIEESDARTDQEQTAAEAHPSEEEMQKIHRDAQRFSKLLVTEIELYNKNGVEEGRRNKDLYARLKKDIDRSRETYEKRFGHTVANQVDYFYEELLKRLAENDPELLGSGYPGPSV